MAKSGAVPQDSRLSTLFTMITKFDRNRRKFEKTLHTVSARCYRVPMDENEMEYMDNLALDIYMEEKLSSDPARVLFWEHMPTAEDWLI